MMNGMLRQLQQRSTQRFRKGVILLGIWLLLNCCVVPTLGYGCWSDATHHRHLPRPRHLQRWLLTIRGGQQQQQQQNTDSPLPRAKQTQLAATSVLTYLGKSYGSALASYPILTKSTTAATIMGLSDYLAQRIEQSGRKRKKYNWVRTGLSVGLGFFYFGPATHAWYNWMFQLFPGTNFISILQKAALGQVLFGPSFMCIFFATALWQSGQWSLPNWWTKIRRDLPGAWLAGIGFWPLVDIASFSVIPISYIPLFVNLCSLVWTIYLSMIANQSSTTTITTTATPRIE